MDSKKKRDRNRGRKIRRKSLEVVSIQPSLILNEEEVAFKMIEQFIESEQLIGKKYKLLA
jgi:hypothetical protein